MDNDNSEVINTIDNMDCVLSESDGNIDINWCEEVYLNF